MQAADYWSALAERLEHSEQVLRLSRPVQTHAVSMPGYLPPGLHPLLAAAFSERATNSKFLGR